MHKLCIFFIISCLSSFLVYTLNTNTNNKIEFEDVPFIEENEEIITQNLNSELNIKEEIEIEKEKEKELMNMEIPKIKLNGNIYNKDSKLNNIDKNIIIMNESDYPDTVGGTVIIGAHSGIGKYAYFKNLDKLDINDLVYLTYQEEKYSYRVINYHLDSKDGFITISNVNNKNKLFLYTCNPNDKENYLVIELEQIN